MSSVNIKDTEQRMYATGGYSTYTNMYKRHPIVRSAVDKIAKVCVASGYQFKPRDMKVPANEASVELLQATFARSRATRLLKKTYTDLLIYGDAYWFIQPSRMGVPYEFIRQDPSTVSIVIDKKTRAVTQYIVRDQQGAETSFKAASFLHFTLFDPANEVYGLSLLESLKSTVSQDLFAQTYNEAFFANSAQTGVIFNMEGATREEILRNREFLTKNYVSAANAHKPLILEGNVKVQKSVATPAEMQFIEGRRQLLEEILAVYDLPYTKLGGSTESANRSQSAENDKSFRAETVVPLQGLIEEEINENLIFLVFTIEDTIFEHKDVDARDRAAILEWHTGLLHNGIYCINDIRADMGRPPIPGGEVYFILTPTGIIPVEQLPELAKAPLDGSVSSLGEPRPQEPREPTTSKERATKAESPKSPPKEVK